MGRTRIPQSTVVEVMIKSARRCCVCRRAGYHIHHIDANNRNNDFENLVLLCFDCHHEASSSGGLKRRLSASELRKLRDDWYASVKRRGQTWARQLPDQSPQILDQESLRAAVIDALAISEIRAFALECERKNWQVLTGQLRRLFKYTDQVSYGHDVQTELLESMYAVTGWVRSGMPYETASALEDVIFASLPIHSVVSRRRQAFTEQEIKRLKTGCSLSFSIAYDGLLRLANLAILDLGLMPLWAILRVARLNGVEGIDSHASVQFERLRETALRSDPSVAADAIAWIDFQEADARDVTFASGAVLPRDVEDRIADHRQSARKGIYGK